MGSEPAEPGRPALSHGVHGPRGRAVVLRPQQGEGTVVLAGPTSEEQLGGGVVVDGRDARAHVEA